MRSLFRWFGGGKRLRNKLREGFVDMARGMEYQILVETDAGRMSTLLSQRAADGAWHLQSLTSLADPAHPSGRRTSPSTAEEVAMVHVAVVTRSRPTGE